MADGEVTRLLRKAREGDEQSLHSVYELLFTELERSARMQLARQYNNTLNTHGLINECFVRLSEGQSLSVDDRVHFLAMASKAMRHVLVDNFRRRIAEKRGGGFVAVTLSEEQVGTQIIDERLLLIDEALESLAKENPRLARVIECKFFGGMNYAEIADHLGVSARTVRLDLKKAKAWLAMALSP